MKFQNLATLLAILLCFTAALAFDEKFCDACTEKDIKEYRDNNPGLADVIKPFFLEKNGDLADDPDLWRKKAAGGVFGNLKIINAWYYHIDKQKIKEPLVIQQIQEAIDWAKKSLKGCISIQKRTTQESFVNFTYGEEMGCSSWVGKRGGSQNINVRGLGETRGCGTVSTLHEIFHSFGLYHQQVRPDLFDLLHIDEDNIDKEFKHNFEAKKINLYGTSFNWDSIMLYSSNAFAKDLNRPTMTLKKDGSTWNQNTKFVPNSDWDFVRRLYGCSGVPGVPNAQGTPKGVAPEVFKDPTPDVEIPVGIPPRSRINEPLPPLPTTGRPLPGRPLPGRPLPVPGKKLLDGDDDIYAVIDRDSLFKQPEPIYAGIEDPIYATFDHQNDPQTYDTVQEVGFLPLFKNPVRMKKLSGENMYKLKFERFTDRAQTQEECAQTAFKLKARSFDWSAFMCYINSGYLDGNLHLTQSYRYHYFELKSEYVYQDELYDTLCAQFLSDGVSDRFDAICGRGCHGNEGDYALPDNACSLLNMKLNKGPYIYKNLCEMYVDNEDDDTYDSLCFPNPQSRCENFLKNNQNDGDYDSLCELLLLPVLRRNGGRPIYKNDEIPIYEDIPDQHEEPIYQEI